MKTIYYPLLLLLILCFGISSCKKDNKKPEKEEEKTQEELIVGKWKLVQGYDLNGVDVADDCEKKTIMEFFADKSLYWFDYQENRGNCSSYDHHLTDDVTYKIVGKDLSYHWNAKDGSGGANLRGMTFEVNATKLTIRLFPEHKGTVYQRIN